MMECLTAPMFRQVVVNIDNEGEKNFTFLKFADNKCSHQVRTNKIFITKSNKVYSRCNDCFSFNDHT